MRERPLSPHLSVYRFQYTMALSFLHRISGIALSLGLIPLTYWLTALAAGPSAYDRAAALLSSWPAKLCIGGWICAFAYHLAAGVRHLCWDTGSGFERVQARASGRIAVIGAVLVALALLWLAFAPHGASP
jgi:succinate dehydrogenase / fumarate reductase cytochrome b subunit